MKKLSAFYKGCLPFINKVRQDLSQPVSQQLGNNFVDTAYEGDWSEIINSLGVLYFRNESNEGRVASFRKRGINKEFCNESKEIRFELLPKVLNESEIKSIRPWTFIISAAPHSTSHLLFLERLEHCLRHMADQ